MNNGTGNDGSGRGGSNSHGGSGRRLRRNLLLVVTTFVFSLCIVQIVWWEMMLLMVGRESSNDENVHVHGQRILLPRQQQETYYYYDRRSNQATSPLPATTSRSPHIPAPKPTKPYQDKTRMQQPTTTHTATLGFTSRTVPTNTVSTTLGAALQNKSIIFMGDSTVSLNNSRHHADAGSNIGLNLTQSKLQRGGPSLKDDFTNTKFSALGKVTQQQRQHWLHNHHTRTQNNNNNNNKGSLHKGREDHHQDQTNKETTILTSTASAAGAGAGANNASPMIAQELEGSPKTNNNSTLALPHPSTQQQHIPIDLVVFYHIYFPPGNDGKNLSLSIVEEQLGQIVGSGAYNRSLATGGVVHVFINTIGNIHKEEVTLFRQICSRNHHLHCYHQSHHHEGHEFSTLKSVHRYCRGVGSSNEIAAGSNSSSRGTAVIYMHNKGSFHQNDGNLHHRRSMTTAVFSRECFDAIQQDTTRGGATHGDQNHHHQQQQQHQCNICGLSFAPWRSPFYPGNFWTASCQYVQRLLDPYRYRLMARANQGYAFDLRQRGKLTHSLFDRTPSTWGIHRYAAEFWVGSHPSVRPCDLVPGETYNRWLNYDLSLDDIQLEPAPRTNFSVASIDPMLSRRIPWNNTGARIREYFLGVGYIIRWKWNYKELPPEDSWFWSFFPDGNLWKEATIHLRHHNKSFNSVDDAIHQILDEYRNPFLHTNGTTSIYSPTNSSSLNGSGKVMIVQRPRGVDAQH